MILRNPRSSAFKSIALRFASLRAEGTRVEAGGALCISVPLWFTQAWSLGRGEEGESAIGLGVHDDVQQSAV